MNGPWGWSTSPPGGAAGEQVEEEQRQVEEEGGEDKVSRAEVFGSSCLFWAVS